MDYTEQAFEAAERIGDIESMGQVIGDLWVVYLPTAQHAKIIEVIPRVIDALEKAQKQAEFFGGLSNVYSTLFSFTHMSQAFLGNFKEAIKFCEMGLQASAKIDSAITLGICESVYGLVRLFKGDLNFGKTTFTKSHRTSRRGGVFTFIRSIVELVGTGLHAGGRTGYRPGICRKGD